MAQCDILSTNIIFGYYQDTWSKLCCWTPPTQTYNDFITGLDTAYNNSCLRDRTFSDHVTTLFKTCLSGGTGTGSTTYWSANTDGSISNSGLTNNVGIGTQTPNEELTVVGTISATTNVDIGGNFIADGAGSNDLDLRAGGITNILLKSRGNTNSYIGNDSWTGNLGVGITVPTNKLHVFENVEGDDPLRVETLQTSEQSYVVVDSNGVFYKSRNSSDIIDGGSF